MIRIEHIDATTQVHKNIIEIRVHYKKNITNIQMILFDDYNDDDARVLYINVLYIEWAGMNMTTKNPLIKPFGHPMCVFLIEIVVFFSSAFLRFFVFSAVAYYYCCCFIIFVAVPASFLAISI